MYLDDCYYTTNISGSSRGALIKTMSELNVMKAIQTLSRPVLSTEISNTTKLCNEEVIRSVSILCKEQKLYTKKLAENISLVWESKTCQPFVTVTPQKFKIPFASSSTPLSSHEATEKIANDIKVASEKLWNLECHLEIYSDKDERLQLYISKLHEYNEIKDTGIVLIGKLAEVESLTTIDLYKAFGLQVED